MRIGPGALAVATALAVGAASAQTPRLLRDVNPSRTLDASPKGFVTIGSLSYFSAEDDETGRELWASDGTAAGTRRVVDLKPGPLGSEPVGLTVVGETLYFAADDGVSGRELWAIDAGGTPTMVKDVWVGRGSMVYENPRAVGRRLYFRGGGSWNRSLWTSDGTTAGTVEVRTVGGEAARQPDHFAAEADTLYFLAGEPNRRAVWRTDGTAAGTVRLTDPTVVQPETHAPAAVGDRVCFVGKDAGHGRELWSSDGTPDGTGLVADLWPGPNGSDPTGLTTFDGAAYFVATTPVTDDPSRPAGSRRTELWRTDGTVPFTALAPGPATSHPSDLTVIGDRLYFVADIGGSRQLWLSDGTEAGTVPAARLPEGCSLTTPPAFVVLDDALLTGLRSSAGREGIFCEAWLGSTVSPELMQAGERCSQPRHATQVGDRVVFTTYDGRGGTALWGTDGTAEGTAVLPVPALRPNTYRPADTFSDNGFDRTVAGNRMLFAGRDAETGSELWATDGTPAGTGRLKDIRTATDSDPSSQGFVEAGGAVFFSAAGQPLMASGLVPRELWRTDGTETGTVPATARGGRAITSPVGRLLAHDGSLYFAGNGRSASGLNGFLLWKSDGTAEGTVGIASLGRPLSTFDQPAAAGDRLYFPALERSEPSQGSAALNRFQNGFPKMELWAFDGTEAAPVRTVAGTAPKTPQFLTPLGDVVYFTAEDPASGRELWRSDGTPEGTTQVAELNVGMASANPVYLTVAGGLLYFVADDGKSGQELWRSDGTEVGTVLVKDIAPGPRPSQPKYLTEFAGRLYFVAIDPERGPELFVTDGTEAGTALVADLAPGPAPSFPHGLTVVGDRLYFLATDSFVGATPSERSPPAYRLWRTDGTAAGTEPVPTGDPGPSSPRNLTACGGVLHFAAEDEGGRELWRFDPRDGRPTRIADLNPGPAGSHPEGLTAIGGRLYFSADDGVHGREPFVLDVAPTTRPNGGETAE